MCTVTIHYKGENDFVLTSNRDEAPNRNALMPDFYVQDDVKMLFPKDELGGGTWIGISDKNRLICLLNGAFSLHERQSNYRHSRGVIVKELLMSDDLEDCMNNFNLEDIEPFTIVVADWNGNLSFFEWVWDGSQKHIKKLPLETHIWSSSTLYDDDMKTERHQWFEDFINQHKLSSEALLKFHSTETKNKNFGIIMDRGFVKTTSITQVDKTGDNITMYHKDLMHNKASKIILPINKKHE